jgi:Transposase DDE domain/Domain of unknown function (DUF4372)
VRTQKGINAVRHHNSVFHGLSKLIPWAVFDRLVDEHRTDFRVRKLSTKQQFLALLFGQLAGAESLRDIEGVFASHARRLYHVGAAPVTRSTLADANKGRSPEVFARLFASLAAKAQPTLARQAGEAVRLIDSTAFRLSAASRGWAAFSATANGIKMHTLYDPDAGCPLYAVITPARVNDITPAKEMPIDPRATYVFDLGYYDYAWWAKLDSAGCRIVTRFKSNTRLAVTAQNPVPEDGNILSDRIGLLPRRLAFSRKNPFADPVREIRIKIETGAILRILSNDLDASAQEIANLYKRRWQIELFFRWIKHTLKIKHFLGRTENAVRIQIAVALIAYLILRLAHSTQKNVDSALAFARLVRANLMHRRPIDRLATPKPPPLACHNQITFEFETC